MRLMLVHRSRFDHGFNPQNAVEAALSRVAKSPPVHARQTHIDALPAPCVLKSTQATAIPGLSTPRAHARISIVAPKSP